MDTAKATKLYEISAGQHGLVTTAQVRSCELTTAAWRHQINGGAWVPVTRRVARRAGAPRTQAQQLLAAVLDASPDAYLSHETCAALWGASGFRPDPIDLMVLRGRRDRRDLPERVHRPRHLPQPFAAVLDGIPVARPALVLLQLAPMVSPDRLKRILDAFWSRNLLSGPSVRAELGDLMHRGRPGTVAMRELLDSLPENYVPPASALEGRFAKILADAGLPEMRRQVDLGSGDRWCGRVDFVDARLPLVVEVDSERYHAALSSQADDAVRQGWLEAAGFRVVRVTDFQVWHRAREVASTVRAARQMPDGRAAA